MLWISFLTYQLPPVYSQLSVRMVTQSSPLPPSALHLSRRALRWALLA